MASYNGVLQPSPIYQEAAGYNDAVSATISGRVWELIQHKGLESAIPLVQSTPSFNTPIEENETPYVGRKVDSFLDDYYYRVHVEPAVFALGAVLSPVQETFIVWNAWFVLKNCSAINKVNPEEFTLTGLTAPFNLKALEYYEFTIDIPEEGNMEFTASITFVFPGESPVVTISGTRVAPFPWEPLTPMTERLLWRTELMKGTDGTEQRVAMRPAPRQVFNFRIRLADENDQARFDALTFQWQKRTWGIPIWSDWVLHTATIDVDDTVITVDTTNADFRDDGMAIIWQSKTSYEVVSIETVAAGSLTLSLPVRIQFTGDKWIMPIRTANMTSPVRRRSTPDGFAEAECTFMTRNNVELSGFVADVTYQSKTLLGNATYVQSQMLEDTSEADFKMADYGDARFDFFSDSLFNVVTQAHHFQNFTRADCWDFRLFLHSLLGRQGTVWVPSFKADLTHVSTIGAADTSFNIVNIGMADNMGLNAMRTHLAFVFPDGTTLYREITGVTESGSEEIISIDTALGLEVAVGGCEISFLDLYRLASDTVEIIWELMGWNKCSLNLVRVTN
jgi:hypothetical protein